MRSKDFPRYGGRGIAVCARWESSFENFLSDMGERPTRDHTIDRVDPNAGYEPNNCRWATRAEQGAEHKRNLRPVAVNGLEFPSISAACRHFGVSKSTVNMRMRGGHSLETAVSVSTGRLPNNRTKESYRRNPDTPARARRTDGTFI